jgi:uncharacterized SAM-binding protein YcdF (DUF218 family)
VGWLLSWLKWLDAPGSIPILVLCCLLALVLRFIWPRRPALARIWLGVVFVSYLVLAVPAVANTIAASLPRLQPTSLWHGEPIDVLVVFDGDNRRGRVLEAKRTYDRARPKVVHLIGSAWMWDALWRSGVPYDAIRHTERPTTLAQVKWVAALLSDADPRRVGIIASRLQMPRVAALMDHSGLTPMLVVSPADREPATEGVWRFVPTYFALRISRDALYEHMALRYYRRNGWIR